MRFGDVISEAEVAVFRPNAEGETVGMYVVAAVKCPAAVSRTEGGRADPPSPTTTTPAVTPRV